MSFLEEHFDRGMAEMEPLVRGFPWEAPEAYALWLGQTYYFARRTTRLLSLCGARFDLEAQAMHQRLLAHAGEERGHEELALDDLRRLGRTIDDVPELPVTSAFYQVQYYWIEHERPISLFGYILLLEGMALRLGADIHSRVLAAHGTHAAKFLKVHTQSDPEHVRQAIAQLEGMTSDEARRVARNFEVSKHLYRGILEEIEARAGSGRSAPP